MKGKLKMDWRMVKVLISPLMVISMLESLRMESIMVKEHSLSMTEQSMLGNSRMEKSGMERFTTATSYIR